MTYTGLNQVATVEEVAGGGVVNSTSFTYNANGALASMTHDDAYAATVDYTYFLDGLLAHIPQDYQGQWLGWPGL